MGLGLVIVADGSKEGASLPCCSLRRVVIKRSGKLERGGARHVTVGLGYSCRRQHGARKGSLLLSTESGYGVARCVPARCGGAR